MAVQAKPEGYHSVTPYLICKDAASALEFYKTALGATELMRMPGPDGSIMHAEFKIGDSPVMIGEESPAWDAHSPASLGGTPVGLCIYVENCDAVFDRAVAAGATVKKPVADQFYGDRSGTVTDPFGHQWTISTHKEDVPPEQMTQRFDDWMAKQSIA
ncbi:MAG: VOC family protein [Planctomycetaceae bacterium]